MNTRRILINAIVSGNIEEIKRLKKQMKPSIFVISPHNGKYFLLSLNKDIDKREIFLAEIEELKKDNDLVIIEVIHAEDELEITH